MDYRIEKDTMGEVRVPKDKYWGAQTERSKNNFKVGYEMPEEIIKAFAILKASAASANRHLGCLSEKKAGLIEETAEEILEGKLDGNFPLVVFQTGSGTQTNMNVNEVIAGRGNEIAGERSLHPNDDVNMSQSSNDTFPTAMSIATVLGIEKKLIPALSNLIDTLYRLEIKYQATVKTGRTHLQDAVPLTFGQEVSGWRSMLEHSKEYIERSLPGLREIALGGTAVGTGLNAPIGFSESVVREINKRTGCEFVTAPNKFYSLSAKDMYVFAHGAIKSLAANLMKIANDIRWLGSGPRCGLGEISIPANEPGSSIMPGKVNPTQAESATMVAVKVMGNDSSIGIAASQGNFELNVFMPLIADCFIESVNLLAESLTSFDEKCISGITVNEEKMSENAHKSLMVAAALNTHIGYEKAAAAAKKADSEGTSLKEAGIALNLFSEKEYDEWINLYDLTRAGEHDE